MIYKESWYGKWNKVMKNLKLVFALIAFIYVQFASGATWTDAAGFTWTYSGARGEATITDVSPRDGSLSIPKTLGGWSVTTIGDDAFRNCSGLTSVTIPDSVTSIGKEAFYGCRGLTKVHINSLEAWCRIDFSSYSSNPLYYAHHLYLGNEEITSVTVPDGVTSIGGSAFSGCSGLTSVTIPDSVTSIGDEAFYGCTGLTKVHINSLEAWCRIDFSGFASNPLYYAHHLYLGNEEITSVTIPDGVTSIGGSAFDGCSGLTSVTIPESVTSIGGSAFDGCSGLTSVTIPESVTSMGWNAFSGCSGLTEVHINNLAAWCRIDFSGFFSNPLYYAHHLYLGDEEIASLTIPDGVTTIGAYAFSGCRGLTSVTIPDSVTTIGYSAFYNCSGLTSVTIPDGVTTIGSSAFSGCSGLTSVTIPESVTSIGTNVFSDCSGLTSVTIPDSVTSIDAYAFSGCSGLTSVTIPDGVTTIGDSAFRNCSGLTSVTIPESVTSIGRDTFYGCSGLREVHINDLAAWCRIDFSGDSSNPLYYAHHLYLGNEEITSVTIPESVTSIDWGAFSGCSGLTSVTIPESVTTIGSHAFYGCSGLTSVTIPESVTTIGDSAFSGCSGLTEVHINDLAAWCRIDFSGNSSNPLYYAHHLYLGDEEIASLTIPDGVTTIGAYAFSGYRGLTSVTIPESVTSIGPNAFSGCSGLTSVTIPESVTSIGGNAFSGCSGLTSVTIPESVTSIGDRAFYNCSGLTSVTIPESVTSINWGAFSGCSGLTSVTIPDSVTSIGDEAFYNCSGLTSVTIPDGVTSIGRLAFGGCSGLTSVTISDGVTSIGGDAFRNCSGLTSVTIPDSVTKIGYSAFEGCSRLTSVTIPDSVTSIGGSAFYGCSRLTEVHINDLAAWCRIDFSSSSSNPLYYAHHLYLGNEEITSVTIPESVTSIGSYVFSGFSGLTSVTIPESVTSIGWYAFSGFSGLTSVTIPESVTSIDWGAFSGCSGLTSVTIPESVTSIGRNVFSDCSGLTSVTIPDSVTSIDAYAFSGCSGLTSVTIPDGVTSIGDRAFRNCSGLTSVTIPDSVTSIGSYAFYGCSGLKTVYTDYGNKSRLVGHFSSSVSIIEYFRVAYPLVDGTLRLVDDCYYIPGTAFSMPEMDMKNEGYVLVGWDLSALAENPTTNPLVVVPQWEASHYRINLVYQDGLHDDETLDCEYGVAYDIITPNRKGCTFLGWARDSSEGDIVSEGVIKNLTAVNGEIVNLYAVWNKKIVMVDEVSYWYESTGDGLTILGVEAVEGCVVLPNTAGESTVAGVEPGAFDGKTDITTVVLDSQVIVDQMPFKELIPDSAVVSVEIGPHVTRIPEGYFADCTAIKSVVLSSQDVVSQSDLRELFPDASLESVTFADGVTSIQEGCFDGCDELRSIAFADSVVSIPMATDYSTVGHLAEGKSGLWIQDGWVLGYLGTCPSEVTIPSGVKGIAGYAFEGQVRLKTIRLPESLTSIGVAAFRNCTGLQNLELPSSLTRIHASAFASCTQLPSLVCPEGLTAIDEAAFSNCWRMVSVSIPVSVDTIGANAFRDCDYVTGVKVPTHVKPLSEIFPTTYAKDLTTIVFADGEETLCEGVFEGCTGVLSIRIPESVETIPARAFKDCAGLTSLALPEAVTTIGDAAFDGCAGLARLTLPSALTTIGERAFAGLRLLDQVAIPEDVTEIGAGAFAGCPAVRQIRMPGDIASVASLFPDAYASVVRVTVPDGTTSLADGLFDGCAALAAFEIPSGVTVIGNRAFAGCTSLPPVTLPDGLKTIGSESFAGVVGLTTLDLPAGLVSVGADAFAGCPSVRSVSLPGSVGTLAAILPDSFAAVQAVRVTENSTALMPALFADCAALVSVDLPTSVREIGASTFAGCTSLASVGIPSGVVMLGEGAFAGCSVLGSVTLPGGLEELADEAFAGCAMLGEIVVPESVASVGSRVFDGCTLLRTVKFIGNAPDVTSDFYVGTSTDLTSYVSNGTTGWDGIDGSDDLPRAWPTGTSRKIYHWDPNRFAVTFDTNNGSGETMTIEQLTDTTYRLPDVDPVRPGAAFMGWWNQPEDGARITPMSRVLQTSAHTLYAQWRPFSYGVRFDGNGGDGTMEEVRYSVDKAGALPTSGYTWIDHDFLGWATEPEGEVVYADGAEALNLSVEDGGLVTLYAVWQARAWSMADYLNTTDLVFTTEGDATWFADTETSHDGVASLRSGVIGMEESSTLKTSVHGAGEIRFWWKVNCEDVFEGDMYDFLEFTVDGEPVEAICGDTGWAEVVLRVEGDFVDHELAWTFTKDDWDEEQLPDIAWVDQVTWTPDPEKEEPKVWTLSEVLNAESLTFQNDSAAAWTFDFETSHDGEVALKSGALASTGRTTVSTTVSGPGSLTFWWKGAGYERRGKAANYVVCSVDGVGVATNAVTDWVEVTVEVNGAGAHTLAWTYEKTLATTSADDCAWLDAVSWTPSAPVAEETTTTEVAVPFPWLKEKFPGIGSAAADLEAKANETAANGLKVWECYVAGLEPTDPNSKFTTTIEMVDGKPVVTWEPDLDAARKYTLWGAKTLERGAERSASDPYQWEAVEAGREGEYRFFKVMVEMP